ncbi:hypothetical protein IW136_006047, partial [Coemansia sp. RSA 678]
VVGDDSWMALAAAKSRLSQQADVLMSTVAALNAGLSMLGGQLVVGNESARAHAFVGMVKEPARPHPSSLQMLALPVALLFGRPNDAIRMLWAQLLRAVRRIVRRLPSLNMLLLLAYKRFRIHAMILWAGALLAWQANAAVIWSNLRLSWQRGISVTAVPPSPDERMPMTPIPKPTSTKAHFNASLDVALQLLQKRNGQIENTDPQTPVNWATSTTTKDLPRPRTKDFPELYAAMPDDLITASAADTPFLDTPTCCNSRASSSSLAESHHASVGALDANGQAETKVDAECQ